MNERVIFPLLSLTMMSLVLLVMGSTACCAPGEVGPPGAPAGPEVGSTQQATDAGESQDPGERPQTDERANEMSADTTDEAATGDADDSNAGDSNIARATFGAGCYWCVEAVFEQLEGVRDVRSGFMGGHVENPTYEQVCYTDTGHAEVVHIEYDPSQISYENLLYWLFKSHDPTTLNRQGADRGTQYRSVIFYHDEAQRKTAEAVIQQLTVEKVFDDPIVTEVTEAGTFYPAKAEHQDFYRNNKQYGYCRAVIVPKLDKLGLQK